MCRRLAALHAFVGGVGEVVRGGTMLVEEFLAEAKEALGQLLRKRLLFEAGGNSLAEADPDGDPPPRFPIFDVVKSITAQDCARKNRSLREPCQQGEAALRRRASENGSVSIPNPTFWKDANNPAILKSGHSFP